MSKSPGASLGQGDHQGPRPSQGRGRAPRWMAAKSRTWVAVGEAQAVCISVI